jgi:hypothetical protein
VPKKVVISLVIFYAISFLTLLLIPNSLKTYLQSVYNADLLYPFSIYQGILHQPSKPDWVFGGYTPFYELFVGFLFWLLSRNIQTTFLAYAIFQHIILTLSILFVAYSLVGKNIKIFSLVFIFSAVPVYLYAFGIFKSGWFLFSWYTHITTVWMGWFALGLLIKFLSASSRFTKNSLITLLLMSGLIVIAVMSDALFIAQFIIPTVALIVLFLVFKLMPFRKGAYLGLAILYATAGGLALYRLPTWLGSDRIVFYGSYFKPSVEQLLNNFYLVITIIPTAWESSPWINTIWIIFYTACLLKIVSTKPYLKRDLGSVQKRLLIFFTFLMIQLAANIVSGFTITTEPGVRYFLPIVFTPLFWGWPFLMAAMPGWMKLLRGRKLVIAAAALPVLALFLLFTHTLSIPYLLQSANAVPDFVKCMDQKAGAQNLRRGMANYWQARPVTLFSKTGLVVVQVDPTLAPFRILNNSDGYADLFDFVIISNDPRYGYWMDRDFVLEKFGSPASTFFCEQSEILVYNRKEDTQIRNHFEAYFQTKR